MGFPCRSGRPRRAGSRLRRGESGPSRPRQNREKGHGSGQDRIQPQPPPPAGYPVFRQFLLNNLCPTPKPAGTGGPCRRRRLCLSGGRELPRAARGSPGLCAGRAGPGAGSGTEPGRLAPFGLPRGPGGGRGAPAGPWDPDYHPLFHAALLERLADQGGPSDPGPLELTLRGTGPRRRRSGWSPPPCSRPIPWSRTALTWSCPTRSWNTSPGSGRPWPNWPGSPGGRTGFPPDRSALPLPGLGPAEVSSLLRGAV